MAHVLFISEDYVTSPEAIEALPESRVRNMDVAESGYAIRTNNGSDAGQEIVLHSHEMGGRKLERL